VLVLNKKDLAADWRIAAGDVDALRRQSVGAIESSAKTGDRVEAAFQALARAVL
jgi:50S ribosomal subunit-associated GTPase HflX